MMRLDRRRVLAAAALAACSGILRRGRAEEPLPQQPAEQMPERGRLGPLCLFAKHLQWLSFPELADLLVDMEVEGIEATIRSGGQVEPSDVGDGLPRLVDALSARDRRVVIMTSDINAVDSPHAELVLRTAASLDVPFYRMQYYRYDLDQPILPQLDAFTRQAETLAELNRSLGITGLYQNHAGDRYLGAPLWDLHQMLTSISGGGLRVAYDVRHATVEGGLSWPLDWALIRPHIGAVYLKDFKWIDGRPENVPLGTGQVSHDLLKSVADSELAVPVSLHMEYIDHRRPELIEACVAAYRNDRQTVRRLMSL